MSENYHFVLTILSLDAEVLLLTFLPGLIFRDAYTSNVFLFQKAFWQCVVMAFPMVLAGTCLTALIGYFILPYGWSWSFCMMFGAIMSATDPVAVSALLNEVGAPPRLKIHISGESLMNDGSAIGESTMPQRNSPFWAISCLLTHHCFIAQFSS